MICPKCGAQFSGASGFCPACRSAIGFGAAAQSAASQNVQQNLQFAQQAMPQYIQQSTAATKSKEGSFISKLKNDKLNLILFCAGIVLALALVVIIVVMITSGGASSATEQKAETGPTGICGVWAMTDEDDPGIYYFLVLSSDGKGKEMMLYGNMSQAQHILWETEGNVLKLKYAEREDYDDIEEFVYELKGECMYLHERADSMMVYWVSSDTDISYDEMLSRFDEVKVRYLEALGEFEAYIASEDIDVDMYLD